MEVLKAADPRHVGGYRLLGRIGRGGMGQVFLGESRGGRKVAVKLIRPEYTDDPEFRVRFAREVEAARKVGGFHTALVVDADPDADPPWMVTSYVAGPSLLAAVEKDGPLPPEQVSSLGAALAEGLAVIHGCGLIHRDLKPSNVILAEDGPRIIDFGVARSTSSPTITMTGVAVGSIQYMSPEQLGAAEIGYESDIFSLGSLLVFAATGAGPFDAKPNSVSMVRILTRPPDLRGLTGPLRDIVSACLAKEPAKRPDPETLLAYFGGTSQPSAAPTVVPAPDTATPKTPDTVQPNAPVPDALEPKAAHRGRHARDAAGDGARDAAGDRALQPGLMSEGHRLEAHDSEIRLVSFSPDGRLLATGAADWGLCVWDTSTWRPVAPPTFCVDPGDIPGRGFRQLVFTPDSRTVLATREGESVVWRLDAATGKLAAGAVARPQLRGAAKGFLPAPVLSPDGRHYLCHTGVNLVLSDTATGVNLVLPPAMEKSALLGTYQQGRGVVFTDASFAVGGDLVGVIDSDQRIHLWNTSTTAWVGSLNPPRELDDSPWYRVRQLVLSARMATVIYDVGNEPHPRALYQWNLADGQPRGPWLLDNGREGRLARLYLTPDEKTLGIVRTRGVPPGGSGGDLMVSLWDTEAGTHTNLAGSFFEVPRLIFSPDGRLLVTMGASIMTLWDLRNGQPVSLGSRPSTFGDPFNDGVFSPDNRTLVTAEGHAARVWPRSKK